jgi:hypothetical protein
MLDYMKLQIEVLKLLNKEKTADRVRVCIDDLDVLITPDGMRSYRIPAYGFYLDTNKIRAFENLSRIMNTERGQEVQLTQDIKLSENGKDKLIIFVFADGKKAYIKEKYINTILPKLNAKHYYHFYMESPATVLKVFEDNVCVAAFMPIVFKNKGDH